MSGDRFLPGRQENGRHYCCRLGARKYHPALQAQRGWLRPIPRKEQNDIAERFIRQLGIRTPNAEQPIEFLSGGNQQKYCCRAGC